MRKNIRSKTRHSARFSAISKNIDKDTLYSLEDAIALVKANATAKFPEGLDVSMRLGIDPRKSDQNVRGTTTIPHGTGKVKKVAVLAKGDVAKEAEKAGADIVGDDDLIAKIQAGFKDFDVIIAAEDMATQIGKIGKALGPKTPNKRNGTVTNQVGQAVSEIKSATRVEYRADKGGVVNMTIGRAAYTPEQITENFNAALAAVVKAKPTSSKGKYMLSITLSSTMGPGVHVDTSVALKGAGVN